MARVHNLTASSNRLVLKLVGGKNNGQTIFAIEQSGDGALVTGDVVLLASKDGRPTPYQVSECYVHTMPDGSMTCEVELTMVQRGWLRSRYDSRRIEKGETRWSQVDVSVLAQEELARIWHRLKKGCWPL